jgi:hypothetical protein
MTCETEEIFDYVQNDTGPIIEGTYVDEEDNPIDITGWLVELLIKMATPIAVAGTITDGPAGEFAIMFATTDLIEAGTFVTGLRFNDQEASPLIVTYQGYFKLRVAAKII